MFRISFYWVFVDGRLSADNLTKTIEHSCYSVKAGSKEPASGLGRSRPPARLAERGGASPLTTNPYAAGSASSNLQKARRSKQGGVLAAAPEKESGANVDQEITLPAPPKRAKTGA